jgi:hypothetical protein
MEDTKMSPKDRTIVRTYQKDTHAATPKQNRETQISFLGPTNNLSHSHSLEMTRLRRFIIILYASARRSDHHNSL